MRTCTYGWNPAEQQACSARAAVRQATASGRLGLRATASTPSALPAPNCEMECSRRRVRSRVHPRLVCSQSAKAPDPADAPAVACAAHTYKLSTDHSE